MGSSLRAKLPPPVAWHSPRQNRRLTNQCLPASSPCIVFRQVVLTSIRNCGSCGPDRQDCSSYGVDQLWRQDLTLYRSRHITFDSSIIGSALAAERNRILHVLDESAAAVQLDRLSQNIARLDAIDLDAVGREFERSRPDKSVDTGLAGCVMAMATTMPDDLRFRNRTA